MPGVHVGRGSRIRRAILDENVCVPAGIRVGYGDVEDEYFTRTPNGVVVVPATVVGNHFTRPCPSPVLLSYLA